MGKQTLIDTELRAFIDETCEKIIDVFIVNEIYESDKMRYNQVFNKVDNTLQISKPTFNDHLNHLIKKKIVTRKKAGKQVVFLYLNENNPQIQNAKEMYGQINLETKKVIEALNNRSFAWEKLPLFLSKYFALCELRRNRIMFKTALNNKTSNDDLLSLALQSKAQATLQDLIMKMIVWALNSVSS